MASHSHIGDGAMVRWTVLALWIGCVAWLWNVIPIASFETEGAAFAVWSRVGLPLTLVTWLWVHRRHLTSSVALGTLLIGAAVWSALLLVASSHGLDYELKDAYYLRQPGRELLLRGVRTLLLLFPLGITVVGLFATLRDLRRHRDPSR